MSVPQKHKLRQIAGRINYNEFKRLKDMAKRRGVPFAEIIRECVKKYLDARKI